MKPWKSLPHLFLTGLLAASLSSGGCKKSDDSGTSSGGTTTTNTGTTKASTDETVEQSLAATDMVKDMAKTGNSMGAPRPSPTFIRAYGVQAVVNPAQAITYDSSTGLYTIDTGDPNFVFKLGFKNASGASLDAINNPSLMSQAKSMVTQGNVGTVNFNLTFTFATAGDLASNATVSGTLSGTTTVELVNSGGQQTSAQFSATMTNVSTVVDDSNLSNVSVTMNGAFAITLTYSGGGLTTTTTLTNLVVHSTGFSNGTIAMSGSTGGTSFSGTITYVNGTGTGTMTFGSETITLTLNADGSGTYTDSTGTHTIDAV